MEVTPGRTLDSIKGVRKGIAYREVRDSLRLESDRTDEHLERTERDKDLERSEREEHLARSQSPSGRNPFACTGTFGSSSRGCKS